MSSDFDFDTPIATRKRGASIKAAAVPVEPTPPTVDEEGNANAEAVSAAGEPSEKPKYDPDELAQIFDEILFSGEYSEEVSIRGKLNVVFRTRTADELKEISRIVDSTTAVFANTLDGVRSLLQLQYALSFYQGKDLRAFKAEDKARFIGRLPGPVVAALLGSLAKFDDKVFAACQEAEANF